MIFCLGPDTAYKTRDTVFVLNTWYSRHRI